MKVGIFKLISWGFSIRDEINKAFKDDKKISAKEMLTMYTNLSEKIKLPVDSKVQKTLDLISEIVDELTLVTDDNKVSIAEIIVLAEKVCEGLGIDLDKKGFEIPEIKKKED